MNTLRPILSVAVLAGGLLLPHTVRAQEREWLLDAAEEDAFLVFGVPETDDVGVSFWCKLASGKIKIFFPEGSPDLKPDTSADFVLTIGGTAKTLSGKTTANAATGATSIESEMPLDDPVIVALDKADRFTAHVTWPSWTGRPRRQPAPDGNGVGMPRPPAACAHHNFQSDQCHIRTSSTILARRGRAFRYPPLANRRRLKWQRAQPSAPRPADAGNAS
jgi:hypothetical protein